MKKFLTLTIPIVIILFAACKKNHDPLSVKSGKNICGSNIDSATKFVQVDSGAYKFVDTLFCKDDLGLPIKLFKGDSYGSDSSFIRFFIDKTIPQSSRINYTMQVIHRYKQRPTDISFTQTTSDNVAMGCKTDGSSFYSNVTKGIDTLTTNSKLYVSVVAKSFSLLYAGIK
jgi:hypothetical protein